ncbi:hypothetical protein ACWGIB_15880 [Streptomyces xiamenensis]
MRSLYDHANLIAPTDSRSLEAIMSKKKRGRDQQQPRSGRSGDDQRRMNEREQQQIREQSEAPSGKPRRFGHN